MRSPAPQPSTPARGDRMTQRPGCAPRSGLLGRDEPSRQQAASGLFYPLRFSCAVRKSSGGGRGSRCQGGDVASVPRPAAVPHGGDAAAGAAVTPLLHGRRRLLYFHLQAHFLPSASSRRANGPKRSVGRKGGPWGEPLTPCLWGPIVCVPREGCWPHNRSPAGVWGLSPLSQAGEPPGKLLL